MATKKESKRRVQPVEKTKPEKRTPPESRSTRTRIVSIDFETANPSRASACALGVSLIEDGDITLNKSWLIKPHPTCSRFDPYCVGVHGITARHVAQAPEFKAIFPDLKKLLNDSLVIAHNASFDISVLKGVLSLYSLPFPTFDYLCTCMISKRTWSGLPNHKLDSVCRHLKHKLNHHDAADDALACAKIMLTAMKKHEVKCPYKLAEALELKVKVLA